MNRVRPYYQLFRSILLVTGPLFLIAWAFKMQVGLMKQEWAMLLLGIATVMLIPLCLPWIITKAEDGVDGLYLFRWGCVFGVSLASSMLRTHGAVTAVFALPWFGMTLYLAWLGARRLLRLRPWRWDLAAIDAGLMYIAIGGFWAVSDRAGIRWLGFSQDIVLLTAVHFHYAGFVLPVAVGLAARQLAKTEWRPLASAVCACVIAAVPLTAAGITATQLGWGRGLETAAALVMSLGGLGCAGLHWRLAVDERFPVGARWLFALAGAALVAGMVLAATYGLRALLPMQALTIPRMRALHGSINAFGFALPAVVGWSLVFTSRRRDWI